MASVNKAILVGNLGRDPETKYLPSGDAVCNFSIATSEKYKDKSGEQKEVTEWHNICTFKKTAEICGQYLSKGSSVYLEGKIRTRKWQDKDGNDRYTTEIVADRVQFLGGKGEGTQQGHTPQKPAQANQAAPKTGGSFDDMTDDIPF